MAESLLSKVLRNHKEEGYPVELFRSAAHYCFISIIKIDYVDHYTTFPNKITITKTIK